MESERSKRRERICCCCCPIINKVQRFGKRNKNNNKWNNGKSIKTVMVMSMLPMTTTTKYA